MLPVDKLTDDQSEALKKARHHFGRCWKDGLRKCWQNGNYPFALREVVPQLQYLRNTLGPSGLSKLKGEAIVSSHHH